MNAFKGRYDKVKIKKVFSVIALIIALLLAVLSIVSTTRNFLIGVFGYLVFLYIASLIVMGMLLFFDKEIKLSLKNWANVIFIFITFFALLHVALLRGVIESTENYISATYAEHNSVGGAWFSILTYWLLATYRKYSFMLAFSLVIFGFALLIVAFPLIRILDEKFTSRKSKNIEKASGLDINSENIKTNPIPPRVSQPVPDFKYENPEELKQVDASTLLFGDNDPKAPKSQERRLFGELIEDSGQREARSSELLFQNHEEKKNKDQAEKYSILDKDWGNSDLDRLYTNQGRKKLLEENTGQIYKSPEEVFGPYSPDGNYPFDNKYQNERKQEVVEQTKFEYNEVASQGNILSPLIDADNVQTREKFDDRAALLELNKPLSYEESNYYIGGESSVKAGSDLKQSPEKPVITEKKEERGDFKVKKNEPYTSQISMDPGLINTGKPKYQSETMKKSNIELPVDKPKKMEYAGQTNMFESKDVTEKELKPTIKKPKPYKAPPIDLLNDYPGSDNSFPEDYEEFRAKINATMEEFDVPAEVVNARRGPTFTLYELKLGPGYQVNRIRNLKENLKMRLEVSNIRIQAPIEGKDAFGLEIPNTKRDVVGLKSIISSKEFQKGKGGVKVCFGKTLYGESFVGDLSKMPHLLVAGATGTGKSVFLNSVIVSMLYKYSPEDVRLILIDPKRVEMSVYKGLPNLLIAETIKESAQAVNVLKWLTEEMDRRYKIFEKVGCANIDDYNEFIINPEVDLKMARIVLIIDEMADLMMTGKGRVEDYVVRIAQLARACGIHMIIATQRPTVKVITGLIKANILCRVAFAVKSGTDSRVILDEQGAEDLLGKGDMLYASTAGTVRMQGSLVDLREIRQVCDYIKQNNIGDFDEEIVDQITVKEAPTISPEELAEEAKEAKEQEFDKLVVKVMHYFIRQEKASLSSAQAAFEIGYMKAKKVVDELAKRDWIGPETTGSQGREILITKAQLQEMFPDID